MIFIKLLHESMLIYRPLNPQEYNSVKLYLKYVLIKGNSFENDSQHAEQAILLKPWYDSGTHW